MRRKEDNLPPPIDRKGAPSLEDVLFAYRQADLHLASQLSNATCWEEIKEALHTARNNGGCTDGALGILPEDEQVRILLIVAEKLVSLQRAEHLAMMGRLFSPRFKRIIWALLPKEEQAQLTRLYKKGEEAIL